MKTENSLEVSHLQMNSPYPNKYLKTKTGKKVFFVSLKYLISVFPKMVCFNFFSLQSDILSHCSIKNTINMRKKCFIFAKIIF